MLDEAAIERLYARLEAPLYNLAYRWLWNPEDAHDVVQEAFVRLWQMRQRVDMARVEPLVYRIAINLASNRRRRKRLWRWVSLEALRERAAGQPDAAVLLSDKQDRAALQAAIEALPEDKRRALLLCEFSAMSYAEVAEVLNIPPGTVASRRHHALKALRLSLGQPEDEP